VTFAEGLAILAAGMAAGTINTVVGSGTLITFPTLLALGYAPVTANVSNNVGLVGGGLSGTHGYRRELEGQKPRVIRLGTMSVLGAITGAIALLVLPASAFKAIVPVFIGLALVLVIAQPAISRRLERRHRPAGHEGPLELAGVYVTGVYGGYFGAAQGIILLAFLGVLLPEPLHRVNALKNVLGTLVNGVSAVVFVVAADVDWAVAGLIFVGSVAGGPIGARYGRRLPPAALRALIVAVGATALVRLLA
jgi:uncharacterized protein